MNLSREEEADCLELKRICFPTLAWVVRNLTHRQSMTFPTKVDHKVILRKLHTPTTSADLPQRWNPRRVSDSLFCLLGCVFSSDWKLTTHCISPTPIRYCLKPWILHVCRCYRNWWKKPRATGELESSLAATSVMPVPKRPNRKNVPLADFNHAVANMVKPSASVQPPGIQSSGIQSSGIQAPGIQAVPKSTLLCRCACIIKRTADVTGADANANASDRCTDADQAGIHSGNEPGDFTGGLTGWD